MAVKPSEFTWFVIVGYAIGSMCLFGFYDKSPWVFGVACLGAVPLAVWLALRDRGPRRVHRRVIPPVDPTDPNWEGRN